MGDVVLPHAHGLTYDLAELDDLLGEPLVGLPAPLLRLGPLDGGAVVGGAGRRRCRWDLAAAGNVRAARFLGHQVCSSVLYRGEVSRISMKF